MAKDREFLAVCQLLNLNGASVTVERLYKYGHINKHSEALFSTAQVWCAAPSELNDPFECRPWLTFEGTKEEIIESHVRVLLKNNPLLTPDTAMTEAVAIFRQGRHRDLSTCEGKR